MTGYSGSREDELAERDRDFDQIAEELVQLDEEKRAKPLASVALSVEDSDYLRVKLAAMYDAIGLFIAESTAYSSRVHRMLITGDGEQLIHFMLEQQVERMLSVQRLGNVLIADWRHALLMSLDMTPEKLAHWLPEYADQLAEKEAENAGNPFDVH